VRGRQRIRCLHADDDTAADIVDLALIEGISLVRVFNSIKEAEYLAKMLRKADPPVNVEVYDSKTDQIVY
jgi:hypothetical protein